MQTLNTVKMQDLLLVEGDIDAIIPVVETLPDGTSEYADERYFLKTAYRCPVIVVTDSATTTVYYEYLNPGKIYKCKSYVYTDPSTGDKSTQYKWVSITFAENGALAACQLTTPIVKETTSTGTTVRIIWSDPADKANSTDSRGNPDPAANAIWAYTVVVRKQGDTAPTTVYDGEIVGYSSVRNQYNNSTGFIDLEPDGVNYTYNVFAVTRYGVATGLEGSEPTEIDWEGIQTAIREGKAGSIFGLGDIITVEHNIYGSLQMQVVAIDNATIDTSISGQAGLTHSVTFMSERVITRVTYDAPEKAIYGTEVNPGDVQKDENYNVSTNGRATWECSNLRRWLNEDSGYSETTDTKYISTKCYFTQDSSTGAYELVAIPTDPSLVNPSAKGWYEAAWNYSVPDSNKWDVRPNQAYDRDNDADYVKDFLNGDNRRLPGFLAGFTHASGSKKGLVDVLLYVNNTTINDRFIYNISVETQKKQVTSDRIFIPSYRELTGNEPLGAQVFGPSAETGEGKLFPFFDRTKTIPGLTEKRSLLKLDLDGNLSGYYTRTIGTDANYLGVWDMVAPSRLWSVNVCDYTEKPSLDYPVTKIYKCAMSKEDVIERTTRGELAAPGLAICFAIG